VGTYICLLTMTDQGIKDIKKAPEGMERGQKQAEALGGKRTALYAVMGEYDYVGIYEFPSDEVAMAFFIGLSSGFGMRTKTLKAFREQDFIDIVKKLP
jgi:uncharacterized protein with GYD domain